MKDILSDSPAAFNSVGTRELYALISGRIVQLVAFTVEWHHYTSCLRLLCWHIFHSIVGFASLSHVHHYNVAVFCRFNFEYLNGVSQPDLVPTNKNGGLLVGNRSLFKYEPSSQCGGALRLTASVARLTGAAWYSRKVSAFIIFCMMILCRVLTSSLNRARLDRLKSAMHFFPLTIL